MWLAPSLSVKWGPYFPQDAADKKATIDVAQAALGKGSGLVGAQPLITRRQAVEFIAPMMGIENIDAAITALEKEAADDAKLAAEKLKVQQAAMTVKTPAAETVPPTAEKPAQAPKGEPPAAPAKK